MARRTGLREFQLSVAERIRTASSRAALSSKLGFQVGADNWFVALHQVNEVIPVPPSVSVPLTHSWFRGVANVRGNLYSMVDFSAFQGGEAIAPGVELTGRLDAAGSGFPLLFKGTLTVSGKSAAHGKLTVKRGVLAGTLGGVHVSAHTEGHVG